MGSLQNFELCQTSFLAILFLLSLPQMTESHNYLENTPCGILYSEGKFGGQEYSLHNRQHLVNLQEDLDGYWNKTGSWKIENNCVLKTCNETYFHGMCQNFGAGEYDGRINLTLSSITSASCSCTKECKCSDIFMKKASCARAYLNGGCRTCRTMYMDFDRTQSFIPENFATRIEALRLRKGCKLTSYSEQDFQGIATTINSETVEDYNRTIRSYKCECHDALFEPRIRPPRSALYPALVEIPSTANKIRETLSKKGFSEHPGLNAALKSLRNQRSSKNAYIMLLGSSGSGKSSTINLLFDTNNITIAKVGHGISTTTDIQEFRIPVPIDELGVANSELRIIDTPGSGDTRGLTQDAKFLATLDTFLSHHEELKDRLPNVVLIFHKYSDNRFVGEGSQFVRMLRVLDAFRERITDKNFSNVIFVLTHFCSETKANQRRPQAKLDRFKAVIENFTLFPRPIIITVAENKGKDAQLPMINGYFKLPNNEYYPKNLFDKMELVTSEGGDPTGQGVFRTAFRDFDGFNVTSTSFKLVERENEKMEHYLQLLSRINIPVNNTEISQLMQQVWQDEVDVNIRKKFPLSLQYLLKALNLRNLTTKADVPATATAILELLTNVKHDEATLTLLEKGLNITPPAFQKDTIAGFSYNVFKDSYLPSSPFNLDDLQQSSIGFRIPNILTCKEELGKKVYFQVFDTKEKYLQERIRSLGIEGTLPIHNFTDAIKPGYNIKALSLKTDGCTLSATREFRIFTFILNERLDLTPKFTRTVQSLPPLMESHPDSMEAWKQFFNNYGTHVVKSVYGGGAIEIQLYSDDKPCDSDLVEALSELIKFTEDVSFLSGSNDNENNNSSSNTDSRTVLKDGVKHSLNFVGGDSSYRLEDLTKMTVEAASKVLISWRKSLKFNPSVLTTEMQLVPISQIVRELGQNYTAKIESATRHYFKSEIKYNPVTIQPPTFVPVAREDTPLQLELLKLVQESNLKIDELIMEIKRINQEREKRHLQMLIRERNLRCELQRLKHDYDIQRTQLATGTA